MSAAYAAYRARKHPRGGVLLMSTDPAHSLADVLQRRLGPRPQQVPISASTRLTVWEVDAELEFRKFLDRYRDAILSLLESGTMFSRAEIEPWLDTTLPGMAEMAALLAIHRMLASGKFAEIIVDTAPIGHTLRLFAMPEYFARFLALLDLAASRDQVLALHFGGGRVRRNPFVAEWRSTVAAVQQALHQPQSQIVMVTTPEEFSLQESLRTARAMAEGPDPLHVTALVINRTVRRSAGCAACRERAARTRAALQFVKRRFAGIPFHMAEDIGAPVLGAEQLLNFGAHVFQGKALRLAVMPPGKVPEAQLAQVSWPRLPAPVTWTTGKGGVGKTTISAALAVNERAHARARPLTICSTDPAPSLDDIFQDEIGDRPVPVLGDRRLHAVEMDAAGEFRGWAAEMKSKIENALTTDVRGLHVDLSFERSLLTALLDMVPPGVDELAAIFRILGLLDRREWLMVDMAPTGHALELLRMPERMLLWSRLLLKSLAPHRKMALARDVAVEIATLSQRVRELAGMLKDGRRSQVVAVMLAEPLPDRETLRLLHSLGELRIPVPALFVNRVLFADDVGGCRRCGNARQWQMATLWQLRRRYRGSEIYVVRNRAREIAGAAGLKSFINELWQIV